MMLIAFVLWVGFAVLSCVHQEKFGGYWWFFNAVAFILGVYGICYEF